MAANPPHIRNQKASGKDSGVALILVIFVVALATILVVNLTYSSYLGGRLNKSAERSLQAEYLLKSALNLARLLIQSDPTPEDSINDPWATFKDGVAIPSTLLGITEPNLRIELEIRPENTKLSLRPLRPTLSPNPKTRDIFLRLFRSLGFDTDKELDQTGLVREKEFDSPRMVANLIDYMDDGSESLDDGDFQGVETQFGTKEVFPNKELSRLGELSGIPGFTPLRVQKLLPFITTARDSGTQVNINFAPREVLKALSSSISDGQVDSIIQFRDGPDGPFKSGGNLPGQIENAVNDATLASEISSLVTDRGDLYQVIAKVDYETSVFFLRALILARGRGPGAALPEIQTLELY